MAENEGSSPEDLAQQARAANRHKVTARLMTRPATMSAHTSMSFVPESMDKQGGVNIFNLNEEYQARCDEVVAGDMKHAETLLIAQAMSLNSIYNECASIAGANIPHRLPAAEALMRMALKAQAQCTQTLRVLGELKAPKQVSFVKQQNVAAGNQQVNNGVAPPTHAHATKADVDAHGKKERAVVTNELLTDDTEARNGATLDIGTTGGAGRKNKAMETVGAVNWAEDA
ncbi:hypothetical protein [Caballeronia sp. M23-90]